MIKYSGLYKIDGRNNNTRNVLKFYRFAHKFSWWIMQWVIAKSLFAKFKEVNSSFNLERKPILNPTIAEALSVLHWRIVQMRDLTLMLLSW